MATKVFQLTMIDPSDAQLETFDAGNEIWLATDNAEINAARYTGNLERSPVMSWQPVSWTLGDGITLGDAYKLGQGIGSTGEGVTKNYTVVPGIIVEYTFWVTVSNADMIISLAIRDETNDAPIGNPGSVHDSIANRWFVLTENFVVPSGCTTVSFTFTQNGEIGGIYMIDSVGVFPSAIQEDPDDYVKVPDKIGLLHQILGGSRVYDLNNIHYDFFLQWDNADAALYEALRELYYSNERLYFDDGEVPDMVISETIETNSILDYVSITNPSTTQIAYTDSSASLPSAIGDFETTEYSTVDYQAIDVDDINGKETTNPTDQFYLYHKFRFLSNVDIDDTFRLCFKVVVECDDSSAFNIDGVVLYAWDGSNWDILVQSSNDDLNDLTWATAEQAIAQQYIDSSQVIRLLVRSRAKRNGTDALSLKVYYAECEINEDMGTTIVLSHRLHDELDADVINLTTGNTLTFGAAGYSYEDEYDDIGGDQSYNQRRISINSQSDGDVVQLTVSRKWEVEFANAPEEWWRGDRSSPQRELLVHLRTLSGSKP